MNELKAWQGFRGITDERMAAYMGINRRTWIRWRTGATDIPHTALIKAVNLLRIPKEDATKILTKGIKQ